jgi:hypothetical protein
VIILELKIHYITAIGKHKILYDPASDFAKPPQVKQERLSFYCLKKDKNE